MKVLILGGSGMLGHKLWHVLSTRFETYVTFRQAVRAYERYRLFDPTRAIGYVTAENFDSVIRAIAVVQPDVVINCIGIIKQLPEAQDPIVSIAMNALFPHRLANVCQAAGARLIHISTDCVFSGHKGNYTEEDLPDPVDLYGWTKLLGEVQASHCLTLRTSIIGRELSTQYGLLEWFLNQKGKTVKGFARALYTGFTTLAFADLLGTIIEHFPDIHGLWHVSSDPISKYDLLHIIKQIFKLDIHIEKDETVWCDRSLDSTRFRQATGYMPPAWPDMIMQMENERVRI